MKGCWELHTEGYWTPVPDNAQAVKKMTVESRHLCYKNPMCSSHNGVRWNPEKEYKPEPDFG